MKPRDEIMALLAEVEAHNSLQLPLANAKEFPLMALVQLTKVSEALALRWVLGLPAIDHFARWRAPPPPLPEGRTSAACATLDHER